MICFPSWAYMYKHKHLIFISVLCTHGPQFPICTSMSVYFIMLLQDQRDLQQHPIVIHEVELSEEDISLVSSSAPRLYAQLIFCTSVPQQCNLFIIESTRGIDIPCNNIISMYRDHHNYECDVGHPVLQVN